MSCSSLGSTPLSRSRRVNFNLLVFLLTWFIIGGRGGGAWYGFITSSFLVDLPKSGLFSRTQIFVILIREIMVRHMSTIFCLLCSWWWSLVSTPSSLVSLATTASSTASPTSASTSSGNFGDIADRVVRTLTLIDVF